MAALPSSGISTSLVANTLQTSSHDVGTLCTHSNINKWSKHKPINYPKLDGLSDAEYRGTTTDIANGIIYGIKGVLSGAGYEDLHNTSYQYVGGPKGGANSPYRLGDFRGYDHNARPNLYGVFSLGDNNEVYMDIEYPISITIVWDYQGDNTTGVDISEFTDTGDVYTIGDYYPCVMVDNYAKVLYNASIENSKTPTPLHYNDAYYRSFRTDVTNSNILTEGQHTISFFLIRKIQDTVIDLNNWVSVTDKLFTSQIIAIPDATGIEVNVTRWNEVYIAEPTNIGATVSGGLTVNYQWVGEVPTESTQLTIYVEQNNMVLSSKVITYAPISGVIAVTSAIFSWSSLGLLVTSGMELTFTIRIQCTGGVRQKNFTTTVR